VNIRLFFSVIGRFRYLVIAGLLAAAALATISAARVSLDGMTPRLDPRGEEEWHSATTLFVTQEGFPWGRSVVTEVVPVGPDGEAGYVPRFADGGRFQGLATLYAELAQGDDVRSLMLQDGPIEGNYHAQTVKSDDGVGLPLFMIVGISASAEQAKALSARATEAFLLYFRRTQEENRIAPDARVQVQVVDSPKEAVLIQGRRMTRPIFLFVLIVSGTIMLAFALENLRPRVPRPEVAVAVRPAPVAKPERKTA
jgi:hypothetical protein